MRSILLHVEDCASLDSRVQSALSLARASNAHVTCLHVTEVQAYTAFDAFGGVFVMEDIIEALNEQEASLQTRVEGVLQKEDVSWEYRKCTGSIPHTILSYAALTDVIVTGRTTTGAGKKRIDIGPLGDLVLKARCPLLIPGLGQTGFDPSGKAMIAWNGSYEAASAVRGALPLLRLASNVEVVTVEEHKDPQFPSTRLLEYLSRHDIHAELQIETMEKEFVAEALVACAQEMSASYIVLGGYGHSRIGEYIFGGVTRSMLASSPVTVVTAH